MGLLSGGASIGAGTITSAMISRAVGARVQLRPGAEQAQREARSEVTADDLTEAGTDGPWAAGIWDASTAAADVAPASIEPTVDDTGGDPGEEGAEG